MTLYGRPHRSTEPRGLDSPVQAFPPCRDRTVPVAHFPVAWTVLSKRFPHAGTGLSLRRWVAVARQPLLRSSPWLGQSCPSVFPFRDRTVPATMGCSSKTTPATQFPVAWTVLSKRLLSGTGLSLRRWVAGARLSLQRDFSNALTPHLDRRHAGFFGRGSPTTSRAHTHRAAVACVLRTASFRFPDTL
ncbi:MAG: hypothetical protein KatS3mg020_1198 [Fimbriimonadales bacterium]|nr:MAG: hypothetical protein KatS3mg020_1198 [Fimbriimonadales bacterium]